eukprot:SAG11_NODE_866_length_6832_cov_4.929303_2_plen_325_part_00
MAQRRLLGLFRQWHGYCADELQKKGIEALLRQQKLRVLAGAAGRLTPHRSLRLVLGGWRLVVELRATHYDFVDMQARLAMVLGACDSWLVAILLLGWCLCLHLLPLPLPPLRFCFRCFLRRRQHRHLLWFTILLIMGASLCICMRLSLLCFLCASPLLLRVRVRLSVCTHVRVRMIMPVLAGREKRKQCVVSSFKHWLLFVEDCWKRRQRVSCSLQNLALEMALMPSAHGRAGATADAFPDVSPRLIHSCYSNAHHLHKYFLLSVRGFVRSTILHKYDAAAKPKQTKPNQTKPNQTKPNQTKPNQTKPNQPSGSTKFSKSLLDC